jgi:hypothetical protein
MRGFFFFECAAHLPPRPLKTPAPVWQKPCPFFLQMAPSVFEENAASCRLR